ncbi:hypothetical protein HY498_01200 [Candidatus Woesearchaeota archaeon]|nr:hypothetical protein [Candidatus Woesearchaeota archaeon]
MIKKPKVGVKLAVAAIENLTICYFLYTIRESYKNKIPFVEELENPNLEKVLATIGIYIGLLGVVVSCAKIGNYLKNNYELVQERTVYDVRNEITGSITKHVQYAPRIKRKIHRGGS